MGHVSEQKREKEKNIADQLKHESVDNQNDSQREQEHALPTQGESPARIVDAQPVNDSVRNQSDTQVEKQTQVLKKHKHMGEQKREKEENITDKLKYESDDNQKDDQKEQKKTLPIEGENQTRTVDIHPVNNQSKTESVRNQSDTQLKQQTYGSRTVDTQPVNDSVHNQSDKQPKQMQESKDYKHVSEQKREQEKNITDQLKHESVDNQNDGQRDQ